MLIHAFAKDSAGRPAGGHSVGIGVQIRWQDGPVQNGERNGAFVEDMIETAIARLDWYNANGYACDENFVAIRALTAALNALHQRTADRVARGVEGTYER